MGHGIRSTDIVIEFDAPFSFFMYNNLLSASELSTQISSVVAVINSTQIL